LTVTLLFEVDNWTIGSGAESVVSVQRVFQQVWFQH
jgi:hypothetical protein